MYRSTTIIRELVLNLAKVIFMLKHSVKLRRYMLFGDVTACHRKGCVLCAQRTTQTIFLTMKLIWTRIHVFKLSHHYPVS